MLLFPESAPYVLLCASPNATPVDQPTRTRIPTEAALVLPLPGQLGKIKPCPEMQPFEHSRAIRMCAPREDQNVRAGTRRTFHFAELGHSRRSLRHGWERPSRQHRPGPRRKGIHKTGLIEENARAFAVGHIQTQRVPGPFESQKAGWGCNSTPTLLDLINTGRHASRCTGNFSPVFVARVRLPSGFQTRYGIDRDLERASRSD